MSKSKKSQSSSESPRVIQEDPTLHTEIEKMDPKKKWVLIGLAVFCLVIFSVTGPMATVLGNAFTGGPRTMAKLVLPSGVTTIDEEEYISAQQFLMVQDQLFGGRGGADTKDVLAYATKRKLAEEWDVLVTNQELVGYISFLMQIYQVGDNYEQVWRSQGYSNALQFEGVLREVMRVNKVEQLLASVTAPTDAEVFDLWEKDFGEMRYDYVLFRAEDYEAAAAEEEPEEEALQAYYDEELDFSQRAQLENEETVAFQYLLLDEAMLATEAVQTWASQEEPTPEALRGFYDFRRFSLYQRPEDDPLRETDPTFPYEEVEDQVLRDFLLSRAIGTLSTQLTDVEDLEAFAAEKGVRLGSQDEPVATSGLRDLDTVGTAELRELAFAELDRFHSKTFLVDGVAFVAKPTAQTPRELPPLEEIRESVVDFWREKRAKELAKEAADAFVEGLPKGENHVEGDPVVIDGEGFGAWVASANLELRTQDWICKRVRPAADPRWDAEDKVSAWLRDQVGQRLDDTEDGEVVGPFEQPPSQETIAVARIAERRNADRAGIWPGEIDTARRTAINSAASTFRNDQLTYEGLAVAFQIEDLTTVGGAE